MKQFLDRHQTAKLIELGFEKPKGEVRSERGPFSSDARSAYGVGELVGMIPPIFTNKYKHDCYINITHDSANWIIDYTVSGVERPYIIVGEIEFIDAIFAMILKLYETGFYDFETKRYVY